MCSAFRRLGFEVTSAYGLCHLQVPSDSAAENVQTRAKIKNTAVFQVLQQEELPGGISPKYREITSEQIPGSYVRVSNEPCC